MLTKKLNNFLLFKFYVKQQQRGFKNRLSDDFFHDPEKDTSFWLAWPGEIQEMVINEVKEW